MPKKILLVEDKPEIIDICRDYLKAAGFEVVTAGDGSQGLSSARREKPDLIVLDLMLPEMDGLDVCREIRRESNVPIIMLTARVGEADKLIGRELGADDYMTKPFSPRELVARVKARLRREDMDAEPADVIAGPFRLDRGARRVFQGDKEIPLTSTEFSLLEFFLTHPGRAYSRDQLLESVWGEQHYVTPRTVDVHIRRLREQIEEEPENPRYLTTVRGFGYRFEDSPQSA